nr:MAG TPA: hypothetical protein [Caudoviricetes sp.]
MLLLMSLLIKLFAAIFFSSSFISSPLLHFFRFPNRSIGLSKKSNSFFTSSS